MKFIYNNNMVIEKQTAPNLTMSSVNQDPQDPQDHQDPQDPQEPLMEINFPPLTVFTNYASHLCESCRNCDCIKRCSGCQMVYYCNEECQKTDWFEHKLYCGELQKIRYIKTRYYPKNRRFPYDISYEFGVPCDKTTHYKIFDIILMIELARKFESHDYNMDAKLQTNVQEEEYDYN